MNRPADIPNRIYITAHRSGEGAFWSLTPAATPKFVLSPGLAFDAAIKALSGAPAVLFVWSGTK